MQKEQSKLSTLAPTTHPSSVAPASAVIAARPIKTDAEGENNSNDPFLLVIVRQLSEKIARKNRLTSVAPDNSTAESASL